MLSAAEVPVRWTLKSGDLSADFRIYASQDYTAEQNAFQAKRQFVLLLCIIWPDAVGQKFIGGVTNKELKEATSHLQPVPHTQLLRPQIPPVLLLWVNDDR